LFQNSQSYFNPINSFKKDVMIKKLFSILVLITIKTILFSQEFTQAIEDNSYFIEEAYNQEDRVVQHISNGYYTFGPSRDLMYTFTQEWPVFSQKHQLSYTIGYSWLNSNAVNGFSDIMINYRYQLTGHDDFITMSPRISAIIPTGKDEKGLGNGVWGFQFNLPMSKRISNTLAFHLNAGFTILPGVKIIDIEYIEHKNTNYNFNLGGSLIWLTTKNFNVMLEGLHNISRFADENNKMITANQTILSPGIRLAINVNKLQIVPGLAVPITIQDGGSNTGMFFYLSFEHPF
jgi:hypothetical protein